MREDKSVEAAVFSTLYLDLVQGLRQQRQTQKQRAQRRASEGGDEMSEEDGRKEYEIMLRAVVSAHAAVSGAGVELHRGRWWW